MRNFSNYSHKGVNQSNANTMMVTKKPHEPLVTVRPLYKPVT